MATRFDYDLLVIGAGSGGVRAARIAAGHGAKVAIAEEYRVGGTCVIRGCIPKKLLVYGSHYADEIQDSAAYGWSVEGAKFHWPNLRDNVQAEVSRLNGLYIQTLANAGVEIINGRAVFTDMHSVQIGDQRVTARYILIATGARPILPDCPGFEHGITSNEVFHLETLPKHMLIAGGGYIASEFAAIFHGFGTKVTQLYRGEVLLRGWDMELRQRLHDAYVARGIHIHTSAVFERIEKTSEGYRAHLNDGSLIDTDVILHAIGRTPNTEALGLEKAGVMLDDQQAIKVQPDSQTTVPHIYAVGDVTNRIQLTPIAIKEGHAFADTVFGHTPWMADHSTVASAVFSQPPLASVGLSEEAALAAGHAITVFRADFRPMKSVMSGAVERALCKLVVDTATDRILGAHMIGPEAPEIIQPIAIAIKMGATKADFDATVAIHPTIAEEFVLMR